MATLLVEGPGALATVGAQFHPNSGRALDAETPDRLRFGHFGSPSGEEVVVRCRSAESVELHCHGGQAAIDRLEHMLGEQGGRPLSWQQWAAGRQEVPSIAAARIALAEARTQRTALILLDQLGGALSRAIQSIGDSLRAGDLAHAGRQLDALLARAPLGRHLTEPWHVVLAGAPNVGKSSLINALVGYQRAIVHAVPGTTRDVVAATTAVEGWPIELSDTAGLRASSHPIEQAGIELARRKMADADLVVLVFDSSQAWSDADRALCRAWPGAILVHNKADLAIDLGSRAPGLATVAVRGEGIERLLSAIASRLVPEPPAQGAAVPFTSVQIDVLCRVRDALARNDPAAACESLAELEAFTPES